MALSNWDTLAFDEHGKSSVGCFENKNKDAIEIYKNWIYIRSPKMWQDKGSYMKPTIAQLSEGCISICGFEIQARRGPQYGVFVFATNMVRGRKKNDYWTRYFGGIGCSGYKDKVEEVLKSLGREKDISDDWCSGSSSGPNEETTHYITNFKTQEQIIYWDEGKQGEYDYSDDWIGVKPGTLDEFFKWLEKIAEEEHDSLMKNWIKLCKKSKKLRYNQGNAFFANALGVNLEATKVGKAKTPIAIKLITKKPK